MASATLTPVHADLFPAIVRMPDGRTLDPVKVILGHDRVWIYQLTGKGGDLLSEHMLDDLRGSLQHGYLATVDGEEIDIRRSRKCGCGANKTWKPFPYRISMTKIPRR